MTLVAGAGLAVTAVAIWLSAVPGQVPWPWPLVADRRWPVAARALALAVALGSARAFASRHGETPGWLVALAALTATASVVVIASPIWPRATWGALATVAAIAITAAALGGLGG